MIRGSMTGRGGPPPSSDQTGSWDETETTQFDEDTAFQDRTVLDPSLAPPNDASPSSPFDDGSDTDGSDTDGSETDSSETDGDATVLRGTKGPFDPQPTLQERPRNDRAHPEATLPHAVPAPAPPVGFDASAGAQARTRTVQVPEMVRRSPEPEVLGSDPTPLDLGPVPAASGGGFASEAATPDLPDADSEADTSSPSVGSVPRVTPGIRRVIRERRPAAAPSRTPHPSAEGPRADRAGGPPSPAEPDPANPGTPLGRLVLEAAPAKAREAPPSREADRLEGRRVTPPPAEPTGAEAHASPPPRRPVPRSSTLNRLLRLAGSRAKPSPAHRDQLELQQVVRTTESAARVIPLLLGGMLLIFTLWVAVSLSSGPAGRQQPHVEMGFLTGPKHRGSTEFSRIRIETEPPELLVVFGEEILGKTPFEALLEVPNAEPLAVRLRSPFFETWVGRVERKTDGSYAMTAKLTRRR